MNGLYFISAFSIGILGSLHCVGMCGPLALWVSSSTSNKFKWITYHIGRTISYMSLGLLTGLLGESFRFGGMQQILSIISGLILFLMALYLFFGSGKIDMYIRIHFLDRWFHKIKNALSSIISSNRKDSSLTFGLINGFLPCGLVYAALAASIAGYSIAENLTFMFIFGIGTVPLLLLLQISSLKISKHVSHILFKATPYFLGVISILLILRGLNLGIPFLSPVLQEAGMDCCTQ